MEKVEYKFLPWRGINEEIIEGKKTKVIFLEDRMEYIASFVQEVTIAFIKDEEITGETMDAKNYCEEEGVIEKDEIVAFVKYIDTKYGKDGSEINVNKLDVSYGANILTFSFQEKADRDAIFKLMYDWKYKK